MLSFTVLSARLAKYEELEELYRVCQIWSGVRIWSVVNYFYGLLPMNVRT